jgi:hypothetical protein
MGWRIGQFFFLVGLLVIFMFAASLANETPQGTYLLIGLPTTILGLFIMFKSRQPPGESQRFRRIRKMRSRKKDKASS